MELILRNVRSFPDTKCWTAYLFLADSRVGFVVLSKGTLIMQPFTNLLQEWIDKQPKDFAMSTYLNELYEKMADEEFERRLMADMRKGIVVGSKEERFYTLFEIPGFERMSKQQIQKAIDKMAVAIPQGSEILNPIPKAVEKGVGSR